MTERIKEYSVSEDIEENISQNVVSFDNICDDLVELILGYLPFTDKIRLERVSKQWQRCIYNHQFCIHLTHYTYDKRYKYITITKLLKSYWNDNDIRKQEFENVLKKCKYIRCVQLFCDFDDSILQLIGKYLPFLEHLEFDLPNIVTENGLLEFGRKYGHKLKTLDFGDCDDLRADSILKFLYFCPNITELNIRYQNTLNIIIDNHKFLPRLQIFKDYFIVESEQHIQKLRILSERYSNQIKKIGLHVSNFCLRALSYVSTHVNLQNLNIVLYGFKDNDENSRQNIIDYISKLSKNCSKLIYLSFNWNDFDQSNDLPVNMFYAFSKFSSVKNLELNIETANESIECKSECFKWCYNIKHLSLDYICIGDEFFIDIGNYLPNIRSIDIQTERQITDKSLISLSKLIELRKLWIRQNKFANKYITDMGVCQLIDSCIYIEHIWFMARPNITNKTIDKLIEIALKRKRISIKFCCFQSDARDELLFEQQIDVNYLDNLPNNLNIDIY